MITIRKNTIKKVIKELIKIFKENPNFTGRIIIDFCIGGITNFNKTEKIKIK